MSLLLTQEEKDRFISWLQMEITSDTQIIEQMKQGKVPDIVITHFSREMQAKKIVCRLLEKTESMTIGPKV